RVRGSLPQRQLPLPDALTKSRAPLHLLAQVPPGELSRPAAPQLEVHRGLGKTLLENVGADLGDDAAGLVRQRVARLHRVEETPAPRPGRLEPSRVNAARELEGRNDLQHRRRFPTSVRLRAEMIDAPLLAT